jgi:hypothetical protein
MSINNIKGNIGGIDRADFLKQQELTEPSRKGGNFAGLSVKQVPPPEESPIAMAQSKPQGISTYTKPITNIDPLNNSQNDLSKQLQNNLNNLVNVIQQIQATAKGAENPNAFAGTASIEAIKKGEGVNRTGLGEGVSPARRLEATNDPVRLKDSGETGAARKATNPTDQVSQILAKVVEMQKQLVNELSSKPNLIKSLEKNQ